MKKNQEISFRMKSNAKKKTGKKFLFQIRISKYIHTHTRDQREISFGINDDDDDKVFLQWTHIIYSTTKKIISKQKKAFNKL